MIRFTVASERRPFSVSLQLDGMGYGKKGDGRSGKHALFACLKGINAFL